MPLIYLSVWLFIRDFSELTLEKCVNWLVFFRDHLHCSVSNVKFLQSQLEEIQKQTANVTTQQSEANFVAKVTPAIKTGIFDIFIQLIFPACTVEVTSARDRHSLLSFGLHKDCALAVLIFQCIFSIPHEASLSSPIILYDDQSSASSENNLPPSSINSLHPYDNPTMCQKLWLDLGVGSTSIRLMASACSTYMMQIRNSTSKYYLLLFHCRSCHVSPYLTTISL